MSAELKGVGVVQHNLNKEIRKIKGLTMQGLILAAAYIRRRMDEVYPKVPISPGGGFLRSSWTTDPIPGFNPALRLGFGAEYAWVVHEKMGGHVNWSRPGSGPKFLQARLEQDRKEILNIIAKKAKV